MNDFALWPVLAGTAAFFAVGAFASLGLPGLSGFIAEFQIFTGSIAAAPVTAIALVGIVGPPESWRASLCGFPVLGRGVLVVDWAHHARRAVPALLVVEPVAPVQYHGLGLAHIVELVA